MIGNLKELRILHLWDTEVKDLPLRIKDLDKLERIALSIGKPFSRDFESLVKDLEKKGVSVYTGW